MQFQQQTKTEAEALLMYCGQYSIFGHGFVTDDFIEPNNWFSYSGVSSADSNYVSSSNENGMDFIDEFLKERENLTKDAALELKLLVQERKQLHKKILETMDNLICRSYNLIHKSSEKGNPEFRRRKTEIDKHISSLRQEKIREDGLVWKDLVWLEEKRKEVKRI